MNTPPSTTRRKRIDSKSNSETTDFEPTLWRDLDTKSTEQTLAWRSIKSAFWKTVNHPLASTQSDVLEVQPDQLSAPIVARVQKRATVSLPHRPGDPDEEYDGRLLGLMERTCPQFNLRNVSRHVLDVDMDYIEWGGTELPDRRGYHADLEIVRTTRHDPPEFFEGFYSSRVCSALRSELHRVFIENDWEKWYGEDKKRALGSLWNYVPPDGGRRTRPWPELKIVEHKYWKGRLITEEY